MSRGLFGLGVLVSVVAGLVGCGENCQSTCDQVYNVCGIEKPGQTRQELLRDCRNECTDALRQSGPIGDYDPNRPRSSSESIEIVNDEQAAAWIDCVWATAPDGTPEQCEDLDPRSGFCAPI